MYALKKWVFIAFSMTLVVILLEACGIATPVPTDTSSAIEANPTSVDPTPMLPRPTTSSTPTPTSSLPISYAPDGLRMAYIIYGNLYVQDGSNPPVQLTRSGEDWKPTFSSDGEKIVFFRGQTPRELYSINFDGKQEKLVVSANMMASINQQYDEATGVLDFTFAPNTHYLVFNTGKINLTQPQESGFVASNQDLLLKDINTDEMKFIFPPGEGGSFRVSPDGKLVAILASNHVDIIDIDGNVINRSLVTYTPTKPYKLPLFVFWAADSTALIVALPVGTQYDMSGPATYSIWRYPVEGSPRESINLDPAPMGDFMSVSPDGNWILYNHFSEETYGALYLGDLRTGQTRLYAPFGTIYEDENRIWSAKSDHFVYGGLGGKIILGHLYNEPTVINKKNKATFLGWVDNLRYLYFMNGTVLLGEIGKETVPVLVEIPKGLFPNNPDYFTFVFLP